MGKRMRLNHIIILLIVFFLKQCYCDPKTEEIVGKYYSRHGKGIEYIELKSDHTYVHYYSGKVGKYKRKGKWELVRYNSILYISLTNWHKLFKLYETININQNRPVSIASCYFGERDIIECYDGYEFNFFKEKD